MRNRTQDAQRLLAMGWQIVAYWPNPLKKFEFGRGACVFPEAHCAIRSIRVKQ